jgi:hypothetical protein
MFSIKTPSNICTRTKVVNTGTTPNLYLLNGLVYTNSQLTSSRDISCIVNSTKYKLTNDNYNPLTNPLS